MKQEFDRWVSIGNNCMAKYQINRYIARKFFGLSENSAAKAHEMLKSIPRQELRAINGGNLFFDWVYIADYYKVYKMLKSGFNYRLSDAQLEKYINDDSHIKAMRCHSSGIHWMHLFSGDKDLNDWQEQIPILQRKLDHMRSQFLELKNYRTLYVLAIDWSGFENTEIPAMLYEAISELRHGSTKSFKLLICTPNAVARDERGIAIRPFLPGGEAPWFGDAQSWDKAFSDFALIAK